MTGAERYPTLLSPLALGPVTVRNRVVSTSHQTSLVHDHLPTDELVAYHRARAAGGVGAIFIEATAVDPTGLLTAHTLGGYLPQIADGYRRLADAVHEHDTRLLVQLFHGGREQISAAPRPPAVAPSAIPSARFKSEPRALTVRELGAMVEGYRVAAGLAREGGLDGIELSFAHGYLAAQFFSPRSNTRGDAYDGDLDGRLRFAREIIVAVRDGAGPGLAVGVRLSADELAPGQLDAAACAEIATALSDGGALDFVSFALGHSAGYLASTWIAPPPPAPLNAVAEHLSAGRAAVAGTAVLATTRIVDLEAAESLVRGGGADLVGMTRALIADPQLLAKAAGKLPGEPVIECVGCNQACIGHYHAGVPIGCAVNARTGHETRLRAPVATGAGAGERRRVLVIGGGPAGVAAAVEAARWGDSVTLRERADQLGGQLRLAGVAPAHLEVWERWQRFTAAQLDAYGVEVTLGAEVSEAPGDGEYDQVVLATGARPYAPPLPQLGPVTVVSFDGAIESPESVEGPVLVLDWGADWAGLDAAERLVATGLQVTLVCGALHPGELLHQYQRALYLRRLHAAGIAIVHHTELAHDSAQLRHIFSGQTAPLPACASVVLAQGRVPEDGLWAQLEDVEGAVRAGDVLGPRGLEEAVLEGTRATYRG